MTTENSNSDFSMSAINNQSQEETDMFIAGHVQDAVDRLLQLQG